MAITSALVLLGVIGVSSCATCGVMAIVSPYVFGKMAGFLATWIATRPTFPLVDSPVDIDHHVLRRTRLFGCIVVSAAAFWAMLLMNALSC